MTRGEWIGSLPKDEAVFCIARGCDRCGFFLPDPETGVFACRFRESDAYCRKEHAKWLEGQMDV